MKVFLSWSGERSKAVAEVLNDWLRCVIQISRPWISTRDLDRGSLWFGEINDQLKDTTIGVVCLTQENKERPWILFEAGALAKGLTTSRVCTFLIDLDPTDVQDPLAQFNHTLPKRESVLSLVRSLNIAMGTSALDDKVLGQVFDTYWPQFEVKFTEALRSTSPSAPSAPRPKEDVLTEILENTRMLTNRLRRLENQMEFRPEIFRDNFIDSETTLKSMRDEIVDLARRGAPIGFVNKQFNGKLPSEIIEQFYSQGVRLRAPNTEGGT